ncbi:hypothetical protein AAY473_025631 [Plecturocebus cupreus]
MVLGTSAGHGFGDLTGSVSGTSAGHAFGDLTGSVSGTSEGHGFGDLTGSVLGTSEGHGFRDLTGSVSGTSAGHGFGDLTGSVSGTSAGHGFGDLTGSVLGTSEGHGFGDLTGSVSGTSAGHAFGDLTGSVSETSEGHGFGDLTGSVLGTSEGHGFGDLTGSVSGTSAGHGFGDLMGSVLGTSEGYGFGDLTGSVLGTSEGHGFRDLSGLGFGDLRGPWFWGPQQAMVFGTSRARFWGPQRAMVFGTSRARFRGPQRAWFLLRHICAVPGASVPRIAGFPLHWDLSYPQAAPRRAALPSRPGLASPLGGALQLRGKGLSPHTAAPGHAFYKVSSEPQLVPRTPGRAESTPTYRLRPPSPEGGAGGKWPSQPLLPSQAALHQGQASCSVQLWALCSLRRTGLWRPPAPPGAHAVPIPLPPGTPPSGSPAPAAATAGGGEASPWWRLLCGWVGPPSLWAEVPAGPEVLVPPRLSRQPQCLLGSRLMAGRVGWRLLPRNGPVLAKEPLMAVGQPCCHWG